MTLASLFLAALSLGADVFREPLCENLPDVNPEVKVWVAEVAPELAEVRVRELPEKTALDVFGRAAAAGWGSIDVLTHAVFREPCTFYLSREALRAVDAAFELDLLPAMSGTDRKGEKFEMTAILAGRGKLLVFYDRDGILYRKQGQHRDFRFASRVEFEVPRAGILENVHGLCAKVRLFGCVRVRSIVKEGEMVEVRAGTFTAASPLKPIQARKGAAPVPQPELQDSLVRPPGRRSVIPGARCGIARSRTPTWGLGELPWGFDGTSPSRPRL